MNARQSKFVQLFLKYANATKAYAAVYGLPKYWGRRRTRGPYPPRRMNPKRLAATRSISGGSDLPERASCRRVKGTGGTRSDAGSRIDCIERASP
jgi:hypothetical protein